mmetsp:Transcript_3706/g.5380  ORF Transcript_3706/g.5380 Transcript_3706/m.5380 type:complete len:140 (-) Transcript_3706:1114-1533(-)
MMMNLKSVMLKPMNSLDRRTRSPIQIPQPCPCETKWTIVLPKSARSKLRKKWRLPRLSGPKIGMANTTAPKKRRRTEEVSVINSCHKLNASMRRRVSRKGGTDDTEDTVGRRPTDDRGPVNSTTEVLAHIISGGKVQRL